jgi:arsenate reductase-like glutaredoxin family protein
MKITIWHNNVCSTSRKALDYLQNQGHEVSVRNYLIELPSIGELQQVLEKLHHEAPYILRKNLRIKHSQIQSGFKLCTKIRRLLTVQLLYRIKKPG